MKIKQFEDKGLSHFSYVIHSESAGEIVVIDPARDITPYISYAEDNKATITGVIETHPHADFISGHLELHQATGATIYCSRLLGAAYPHQAFDDGETITLGKIKLTAWNTPGHSPDSISIVLAHEGKDKAVFTGDTLFIGDCGRPDLREQAGNMMVKREELARQMYHTLRDKLLPLNDEVCVYPAHGAGTLCGKSLSEASRSTIGAERAGNWSLQTMDEAAFVHALLLDQPFIPRYFGYDVSLNRNGAASLQRSLAHVMMEKPTKLIRGIFIIDARPAHAFKMGHLPGSINIQNGGKFETWLGSIIVPEEAFYLVAESEEQLNQVIGKAAKIGYENFIEAAFVMEGGSEGIAALDLGKFKAEKDHYTIIDIRNSAESKATPIFTEAINIPLHELRERLTEIPLNKPIVVHCAGGYRSAAGSSIIYNAFKSKTAVFDLGEAVTEFVNH